MEGILWDGRAVEVCGTEFRELTDLPQSSSLRRIAPGLTDIQVNGFGGADFNDPELTFSGYIQALRALREHRVTCALPTLITNAPEVILDQLIRLETFREEAEKTVDADTIARAPFYHLEGPFISPEDGYRGAHPLAHVMATDDPNAEKWISRWQEAAHGRIRLMTFSPHGKNAAEFTAMLRKHGILPAIGHTHAGSAQIREAVQAGTVLATHLGNACAQLLPRHANPIWAILAEDELAVSMIPDGFHLPPEMLKTFYRVKGREKTFLISDATQYAGKKPGAYHTHIGGDVILTPERKLHIADSPNVLAGAAKSVWEGWMHMVSLGFATPEECWHAGSGAPLKFLIGREFDPELTPMVFVDPEEP
ncbi:MAG: hypothetical protein J6J31_04010 [Thermoguttaceae bacterium]|nr:hypothetical protein [Thermoguttaceae bacterium]